MVLTIILKCKIKKIRIVKSHLVEKKLRDTFISLFNITGSACFRALIAQSALSVVFYVGIICDVGSFSWVIHIRHWALSWIHLFLLYVIRFR